MGEEKRDEFLNEIDEELKSLHVKVKKIVSEVNTVLQEYGKDEQKEDAGTAGEEGSEN